MMKRLILVLSIFFFMILTACDNAGSQDDDNTPEETVMVVFDTQGGTMVDTFIMDNGSLLSPPSEPQRAGYDFKGWYYSLADDLPFDFDEPVESNLYLYAKWGEIDSSSDELTVLFNSNGGSSVSPLEAVSGENISAPADPVRDGFVFDGWYEDSGLNTPYIFDTMPSADLTLYAKWSEPVTTPVSYTISFDSNDGSAVTSIEADSGVSISAPDDPSKDGYVFEGWYEDIALSTLYVFNTMPSDDLTLYAKWSESGTTPISYTISFDSNDGSAVTSIEADSGVSISAPDNPSKDGYVFEGWYEDIELNTPYVFNTMPSADLTLYAKWSEQATTPVSYTITFEVNGGLPVTPVTEEASGSITPLPVSTKQGYEFAGWYEDSGLTTLFTLTTMSNEDITLYAKWTVVETINDQLIEVLEGYDFVCENDGACQFDLASNVYYAYTPSPAAFTFVSTTNTVESNDFYRIKSEQLIIESNWDVTYTYSLEEDYGIEYYTDLEYSGNVETGNYTVDLFSSNYHSQSARVDGANSRITQLSGFINSIFNNLPDIDFEDLN